jgi:glycerophosphoryl diester phosphodiesterase
MARDTLRWLTARPIAHRGYHDLSHGRPENTLAAFEAAVAAGYGIECDLQLSADGIPVVFHDDNLQRLVGEAGAVSARTADELRTLAVLGTTERIPTLDDLLALVAGRVPLLIEMKPAAHHAPALAQETIARLSEYSGRAAVMSFDRSLLAAARVADASLVLGLTAEGDWRSGAGHWRTLFDFKLDFISYAIADLPTPAPILARNMLRVPLLCWTVRTDDERRKAARWTDQITFEGFAA